MSRALRTSTRMVLGLATVATVASATFASAADKPAARAAGGGSASNPIAYNAARALGPVNVSPGPGFTTVLARPLPKGHFVMWSKVTLTTPSLSTGVLSSCRLLVGAVEVDSSSQSPFNSGALTATTHSLQAARNLTGNAASRFAQLQCQANAVWIANAAKFTAMRVTAFG